jgi:hypothetical protein
MTELVKETVITQGQTTAEPVAATKSQTLEYLIYYFFGALEILLAFRLVLKMMGASLTSGFVRVIYMISQLFIMPFEGIFKRGYAESSGTAFVFEPATVVAIVVYMALAWGIVKLLRISTGEKQVN